MFRTAVHRRYVPNPVRPRSVLRYIVRIPGMRLFSVFTASRCYKRRIAAAGLGMREELCIRAHVCVCVYVYGYTCYYCVCVCVKSLRRKERMRESVDPI